MWTRSYSFSVSEDAALGTAVGTVSASDDSEKAVTYKMDSWNIGGVNELFSLDQNTGAYTVAADLSGWAGTTAVILTAARDQNGGEGTVLVTIQVTES